MCRECRERFPRHRLQRKPLVSDASMHHGTCVTHVLWCMSESLTRGGGENVPGIPGACATHNFTNMARGQCIWQISDNAPYCNRNVHICAHLFYKIAHCGTRDCCIVGFLQQIYCTFSLMWMYLLTDALNISLANVFKREDKITQIMTSLAASTLNC